MSLADVKTRIKMIAQISPLLGSTPSAVILCTFLCSGLVWPLSRPYLTHGTLPWSTNKKQSEGFKGKFYSNKAITTYKTELQTKALLRSSFSTGLCRCASPPQKKKKKWIPHLYNGGRLSKLNELTHIKFSVHLARNMYSINMSCNPCLQLVIEVSSQK